ncbi:MAG: hypothetical protein KUG57_07960 [Ilumatobacteraceae bacterium]|nr:hypothetical protein [Ilumatobacteraceae bacterium]
MGTGRMIALLASAAIGVAACGGDVLVSAERSDQSRAATPPIVAPPPQPRTTTSPDAEQDPDQGPIDEDSSATSLPPITTSAEVDPTAIDLGSNKPERAYDEFLLAAMTDIEIWWTEQYPAIYRDEFVPLQGEIYAAYPSRPDDIPGCGTPRTTYDEVKDFVAFYCGEGDFMVYDDGEDGLLAELAKTYGAGTIGTVLAHEYAHAIQFRSGALDRSLPTIRTEQQADCFAGAWTGRAARGEATTLQFTDADVRAGLIAMTKVSDPVGIDQFVPGGHGSAFDRVGAFQVGFLEGPARCAELLDEPLPLVPNQFTVGDLEQARTGDAPFGFNEENQLGTFLPEDLNLYWDNQLETTIPDLDALALVVVQKPSDVECDDLRGDIDRGTALCTSSGEVYVNSPATFELYEVLGDFSVGYLLGWAWSEAAQVALDTDLKGETRELMNDCLTGAWVKTVVPIDFALPLPRHEDRSATVSAGDLDEAIQTVLLVADLNSDDDIVGSAFEKIDSFRTGVLGGLDACIADL